jgi:GDP-mannose 6-dehydrogenase
MRITIFGMGYVGVVSAACLLRDGHHVTGIDLAEAKIADLANGHTPIQEPGVAELLRDGHAAGRLSATTDAQAGLEGCDMVWICVGTPSGADGSPDVSAVGSVARRIGECIGGGAERPLVVLRSTVLPGTTIGTLIPALEAGSGLEVGRDFHAVFHPEFLREGSAVADFDAPPKIVVGEAHPNGADRLLSLYEGYEGPRFRLSMGEAELVKYSDNLFHAVKVTFANEMGAIARSHDLDARRVAEVFCADTKLNISPRYLRPGFAFGGSCLPKDLRAILRDASVNAVRAPMLQSILESNRSQIEGLVSRVLDREPALVGIVGIAFKENTDDMRESPHVTVAKRLLGEGVALKIFDPTVRTERLIGANKEMVQAALKHLERLLVTSPTDLDDCELILINHRSIDASVVEHWLAIGRRVLDLTGIPGVDRSADGYEGIAW